MTTVGTRLKLRRTELGLNQKIVADVAGVTNAAVSKWETNGGESMSALVAMRLAQRLNVNPFWLVFGQGAPADKLQIPEFTNSTRELAQRIERLPPNLRSAIGELLTAIRV